MRVATIKHVNKAFDSAYTVGYTVFLLHFMNSCTITMIIRMHSLQVMYLLHALKGKAMNFDLCYLILLLL